MAGKWDQVVQSEKFQALDASQRQAVRGAFFDREIRPNTPPDKLSAVQSTFFTRTEPDVFGRRQEEGGGVEATDYAKEFGAAIQEGTGAVLQGAGELIDQGGQWVDRGLRAVGLGGALDAGDAALGGRAPSDAVRASGAWFNEGGEAMRSTESQAAQQARAGSSPTGDITAPSTWSLGEDPTAAGYALNVVNLIGQFAPQAAALLAPGGAARAAGMAGVGGLQSGGAAGDEAEQYVMQQSDDELAANSGLYRDLIGQGLDAKEARRQTAEAARGAAFSGAAPLGAAGGALNHYILGPFQRAIGGGVGRRLGYGLAVDSPAEGAQEVAETVAGRTAQNQAIQGNRDTTENTFGDALLGAIAGAGHSTLGAAMGETLPQRNRMPTPDEMVRERTPEDIADAEQQYQRDRDAEAQAYVDRQRAAQRSEAAAREQFGDSGAAIWQNADNDLPVTVRGIEPEPDENGRYYARVERDGQESFVPLDELQATGEPEPQRETPQRSARRPELGIDNDIRVAERLGADEDAARLRNAKSLFIRAMDADRAGNTEQGSRLRNRGLSIYRDIYGNPDSPMPERPASFPVPYEYAGDFEAGARPPVPSDSPRRSETFDGTPDSRLERPAQRLRQGDQATGESIVFGDGPTVRRGNANTGMDQPFERARMTDTGARTNADQQRAEMGRQAQQAANVARTRGPVETAYLPDNTPVRTRYRVMDMAELTPSNNEDGSVNPRFPAELQPRDRTNANSQVQVRNIAANLNPERLGRSQDAATGAPIVGADGVVESGNGRTMAIAQAYQQGNGEAYRQYVSQQAEAMGMDPAAVAEMQQPVLVRERISNVDRADFARRANESTVAGMTSYEQARADADMLGADEIQQWNPDQSGDPLAASNRAFQRRFVQRLGNNEASRYTTRDGQASPELGQRMQRAVFAKAYNDSDMVEMATEQGDAMRNLTGALQDAAADLAAARDTGSEDALTAIGTINDAVRLVRRSRQDGTPIRELVSQQDVFSEPVPPLTADLALAINANMRSRRALGDAMRYIGQAVRQRAESERNGSLFEDSTTNQDVINEGFRQADTQQRTAARDVPERARAGEPQPAEGRQADRTQGDEAQPVEGPLLQTYTEQDIADRERANTEAAQGEQRRRQTETQRAAADREANDFTLTGSDRTADEAAARGQGDILADTPTAHVPRSWGKLAAKAQPTDVVSQDDVIQQMRDRTDAFTSESGVTLEPTPNQIGDQVQMLKRARMGKVAEARAIPRQVEKRNQLLDNASDMMAKAQTLLNLAGRRRRDDGGGATTAQAEMQAGNEAMERAKASYREAVAIDAFIQALEQRAKMPAAEQQGGIADYLGSGVNQEPRKTGVEPLYSLDSAITEQPPTAEAVRNALAGMSEQLGDFTVVDSPSELPLVSQLGMLRDGVDGRDVRGLYSGDRLYIIAGNNDSIQRAVMTAVHEAVGHKGMRGVLGDELVPVMRQLYNSLPLHPKGREALNEVLDNYPFLDRTNADDQVTIAEEMVAHLLEKGYRPRVWQRAVAKIREILRRRFPSVAWTYTDVLALGEQSRAWLQKRQAGQQGDGEQRFSLSPGAKSTIELFHSGGNITEINGHGRFGSFLFFSTNRGVHDGDYQYRIEISPNDIISSKSLFYEEDAEKLDPLVRHVEEIAYVDEDTAIELIEQKIDPHELDHIDPESAADLSFDIQAITAEAARALGYKGVSLPDEHGTSYMIDMAGHEADLERLDDQLYSLRPRRQPTADQFDDLTAEQRDFMSKFGTKTPTRRAMDWYRDLTSRAMLRIRQGLVDQYAALKELDEKRFGKDGALKENITSSSWVLARMSNAANGALHAMLHNGRIALDPDQKVIDIRDDDSKGLGAVLGQLGSPAEIERFMMWIAANRSDKLKDEGREFLFTDAEIRAGMQLNEGRLADGGSRRERYQKAFDEFQEYRDDVLSIAEQSGIIRPDQRAMWRDEFYVPFYRLKDDKDVNVQLGTSGLSRQQAYKRLKGGTDNINDLLQNTMMNFHHLLDASLKNQAAQQAIENAEAMGMARVVPESNRDTAKSTFVMQDGVKRFYEIDDPMVFSAVSALAHAGMNNTIMKVMRGFKRVFTNMTTTTPQFIVANLMRDTMQAVATNDVSKNVFKNIYDGAGTLRDQRKRARMLAAGGSFNFGHLYSNNPDELRAQLTRNLRDARVIGVPGSRMKGFATPAQLIRAGWAKWGDMNDFAENLNRAAIYEQNQDKGKLKAAFEARDLIDFSARGAWPAVRILTDIVPFLNARIQGLDKIYRSGVKPGANVLKAAITRGDATVSDKQAAARFWSVAGAVTMATVALYLNNHDDEDYQKLEEWQKDTYWFFKVGDQAFFIPKPFEVGAIATMAERITQQFVDDEATGSLFAQRMGHMLTGTFAFSPVPQMMQPALDVYANRDSFTDRPIEGMGDQRLSPELRKRSSTSRVAQGASWLLNHSVGAIGNPETNPAALSPIQIDYLIQGYLGQVGAWAAGSVDVAWNTFDGKDEPAKRWYEYQPIRRFYSNLGDEPRYTRYGTVFYEGLREAERAYSDVKELGEMGRLEEARKLARNNADLLRLRKPLMRAQRKLNSVRKQIDVVRRSDLDGELKRQRIDRLTAVKNRIQQALGEKVLEQRAAD